MPLNSIQILKLDASSDWNETTVVAEAGKLLGFDGSVNPKMVANSVTTLTPNTGDTVALDRNTYKGAIVTVPSGGTLTFTIANMAVGDMYMVQLAYLGTATINWFTTLNWINSGGSAPTYSASNGKVDTFLFFCRTSNNYDVFYSKDDGTL